MAWMLVIAGLVGLFLFLPQFSIRSVSIMGAHVLSVGDIESVAQSALAGRIWGVVPRAQFFLVSPDAIRDSIAQAFPRARTVHVARRFPHTLVVTVEEYEIWGVLCKNNNECSFISRDGTALDTTPNTEGSALAHIIDTRDSTITAGLPAFDEKTVRMLVAFTEGVPVAAGTPVQVSMLSDNYEGYMEVTTQENWRIIVDTEIDPERALENLKLVLAKEIPTRDSLDYIDVRLPNKVFYKFRD